MKRGLRIYVASLSALALGLPATASAATPVSQSFTTPGEQQFVVPPGITSVQVELVGGYGGSGNAGIPGGIPATDRATVTVSPGETLYAEVAGDGQSATGTTNHGGYGGGGNGAIRVVPVRISPDGRGRGRSLRRAAMPRQSHERGMRWTFSALLTTARCRWRWRRRRQRPGSLFHRRW